MMMANEGLFGFLAKRCFKKILVVTIASCERGCSSKLYTLPETNSEFTPENGCLEANQNFFWGVKGLFSRWQSVSFGAGYLVVI